jgi:hypothetical protein
MEDAIRDVRLTTSTATDERIMAAAEAAMKKTHERHSAAVRTSGTIRRIIMNSKWTKLATAAAVVAAILLAIHALTGSGTSITIAQVEEAMQDIDWMQIINVGDTKGDGRVQSAWFSFASKLEILVDSNGGIIYRDFNAGKKLVWNPGSQDIYESPIDQRRPFIGDFGGPFEFITKLFSFLTAERGWKITKELGTYQGRRVEVWAASRIKENGDSTRTEMLTAYIDVEKKLPIARKQAVKGPDGNIRLLRDAEFGYPETGPADIYEAGAPRSAQIKPSPQR